ncbi:MAG: STAS domain-containing protein [Candidatus Sulfotelmatobacter sp.]
MLNLHTENIGEMAVVECEGRIVQSESASKLRQAVTSQLDAQIIVLDLSEVPAIEAAGLGMLVFLQRWAQNRGVKFKLFNPRSFVRDRLERVNSMQSFDIATLDEMMALVAQYDSELARAA